jgi:6-hydroxytryprostatin B O-methyltransferase
MPESRLVRLLRFAMTARLFCEPRPGFVAHTANSALWLRTPQISDWVRFNLEDAARGSTRVVDSIRLFGESDAPGECGLGLAIGLPRNADFFQFFETDGEGGDKGRMTRFSPSNAFFSTFSPTGIHAGFDWKALGDGTVVDVRLLRFFWSLFASMVVMLLLTISCYMIGRRLQRPSCN